MAKNHIKQTITYIYTSTTMATDQEILNQAGGKINIYTPVNKAVIGDVVSGISRFVKYSAITRITASRIYYKELSCVGGVPSPDLRHMYRLYSRYPKEDEKERYIARRNRDNIFIVKLDNTGTVPGMWKE
jgi:hypothetical protein